MIVLDMARDFTFPGIMTQVSLKIIPGTSDQIGGKTILDFAPTYYDECKIKAVIHAET